MFKNFKGQLNLNSILDYVQTPIENYPDASTFRQSIYVVEAGLICIFSYLWLEYTQMDGLFKSVYPIIIATIIIISQYLVVEFGGRLIYKHWQPFKINIGKFWGLSFVGVFFGFTMVYFNAQCIGIEKLYPDIFYFYTEHPAPLPSRLAVFYKIILIPWMVATFLLTQGVLKKQLEKELAEIKQINDKLEKKKQEIPPENKPVYIEESISKDENEKKSTHFETTSEDGFKKIAFIDIYYIAVKDHYCQLVINKEGELHKELLRLSLKQAMAKLPSDYFVQVHRSYTINLQHVLKINKKGQAFQLLIRGTNDFIPASRHRAQEFLPKIKKILG